MGQRIPTDETERLIASDKVEGTAVYGPGGDKLGSVMNFMVDKRSGKAEYAVLEFGGILGMGSDYYPIPWEMLEYDTGKAGYVVDLDKSKLQQAPRYQEDSTTFNDAYARSVNSYYGTRDYPII